MRSTCASAWSEVQTTCNIELSQLTILKPLHGRTQFTPVRCVHTEHGSYIRSDVAENGIRGLLAAETRPMSAAFAIPDRTAPPVSHRRTCRVAKQTPLKASCATGATSRALLGTVPEEPPVGATRGLWSLVFDTAADAGLLCHGTGRDPRNPCGVMSDAVMAATVLDVGSSGRMLRCTTPVRRDAAGGTFAPLLTVSGAARRLY